jgi:predicted AAA+ superfamily ATPase
LRPWYANTAKRQVRSPKVYVRDSGFVIEQILMFDVHNPWFWGTHTGAELDLMVDVDGERVGVEVKRTDQPRLTPSMRHALDDLALDRIVVVHAGAQRFHLAPRVEAIPVHEVLAGGLGTGQGRP